MSNRLYTTNFTVPALTAIAAPFSQAVPLDDVQLDSVRIIIPPGHIALTGLAIFWSGTQIVPYGAGTWISGDDEIIDYPFDGEITEFGLSCVGYNTDIFPHSFKLRWLTTDLYTGGPVATSSQQLGTAQATTDQAAIASLTTDTTSSGGQLAPDQQSGALVPDLTGGTS